MANDKIHAPGIFPAKVLAHGWNENKNTGALSLQVQFETAEGTIHGWFYMTDKAAPHTLKKIAAMGYTGDDLGVLGDGQVLVGNSCIIEIEHEVGKDCVQRAKVSYVHPEGWTPGVKNSADAAANVKRFNALWKKERGTAANGAGSNAVEEVPFH